VNKYILLLCLVIFGCERPEPKSVYEEASIPSENFVLTNDLADIRTEFNKMSEDDQDNIYKQIAGAVEFLDHAKNLNSTSEWGPLLNRVQSDFGWQQDKYPAFDSAVDKYLISQGVDVPRSLKEEDNRVWFRNIFVDLKNAIKVKE